MSLYLSPVLGMITLVLLGGVVMGVLVRMVLAVLSVFCRKCRSAMEGMSSSVSSSFFCRVRVCVNVAMPFLMWK